MKLILKLLFVSLLVIFSCKNEMRPIAYGKDNCEQCRMTIIDPQFGAAMLTSKGKVFTFDSGECLVRYLKARGINEKDQYFVSDFTKPGTLVDANRASFLHGDSIQSPMGGNLAAFSDANSAKAIQKVAGGELLEWNELLKKE